MGPRMQLGRCEEGLYQQQVKRQQQQQSAGIPNRMSLHEKGIAVVREKGVKRISNALNFSEAEYKGKHFLQVRE